MQRWLPALITIAPLLAASASLGYRVSAQAPSTGPMRVALLVDTSEATAPAISQLRTGVVAFIDALPPEHEIALVSTGRRVQVRVQPTIDRKKLLAGANGLLSDGGATPLADALLEVNDRFMKKADHPVFVIVTGDGPDSSIRTDDQAFNGFLQAAADEADPGPCHRAEVQRQRHVRSDCQPGGPRVRWTVSDDE